MRGAVLYGPRDVRFEERPGPEHPRSRPTRSSGSRRPASADPTSGRIAAFKPIDRPTPMGHEYCGIVEEVGARGQNDQAGPVRDRLVLRLRQHVPALPARLPDRRACTASSSRGAQAPLAARAARRRHAGRDAGAPVRRSDPEPARGVRRAGHRLVRGRRGEREAGCDGRGRRRRRGRAARRALREADGRRADHRDEPPRGAAEARARVRRDRHRDRARRRRRRAHQGADEGHRRRLGARVRRHAGVDDAGDPRRRGPAATSATSACRTASRSTARSCSSRTSICTAARRRCAATCRS